MLSAESATPSQAVWILNRGNRKILRILLPRVDSGIKNAEHSKRRVAIRPASLPVLRCPHDQTLDVQIRRTICWFTGPVLLPSTWSWCSSEFPYYYIVISECVKAVARICRRICRLAWMASTSASETAFLMSALLLPALPNNKVELFARRAHTTIHAVFADARLAVLLGEIAQVCGVNGVMVVHRFWHSGANMMKLKPVFWCH